MAKLPQSNWIRRPPRGNARRSRAKPRDTSDPYRGLCRIDERTTRKIERLLADWARRMTAVTPVERWPAELQRVVDYWAAADGVYVLPEGQRRLAEWIYQCQAAEYQRQQHEAAARAVDDAEQGIPLQLTGFSEEESRAILTHSAIQRETEAFNEAQDQRLAQAARRMGELARAATAASEARRAATPSFWHDVAYLGENARHQIGQWAQSATRAAEDTGSPALAVVVAGVSHVGSAVLSAGTCVIDVPAAVRGGIDEFNTTVEVAQKYNVAVAASHLVGLRQISEAVYGVDILTLEEVDWAHKTAEAFGRLGGTAAAGAGGVGFLRSRLRVPKAGSFPRVAAPRSKADDFADAGSRVARPGSISGNPANRLVETGKPLKNGDGWARRWIRMTEADELAQRRAIADRYDALLDEATQRGLSGQARRDFLFEQMRRFREKWLEDFLENRDY